MRQFGIELAQVRQAARLRHEGAVGREVHIEQIVQQQAAEVQPVAVAQATPAFLADVHERRAGLMATVM